MSPIPRALPAALALCALLTGCQSAPTRLYSPYAVPPAAAGKSGGGAYPGPPVRVDAVHFPPSLDRIEIVREIAPGEMAVNDLEHWSAPLAQSAREVLSADLLLRLPPGKALFPHLTKPPGALGVSVDVLEFTGEGGQFILEASWAPTTTGSAPDRGVGTATLRTRASGGNGAATTQALSDLLGQLADRIVATL
jgi:uncharacterized lipoprotein YmbA